MQFRLCLPTVLLLTSCWPAVGRSISSHLEIAASLMEIVPAGTPDPSPALYNTTLYAMGGLLSTALLCNLMMKPVHPRHHIKEN